SEESRRAGLLAVSRSMPPRVVLSVARGVDTDPSVQSAILGAVGTASATDDERRVLQEIALLRAEIDMRRGRPDAALGSLAALDGSPMLPALQTQRDDLTTRSLIMLNRLEEAASRDATAEVWLAAVESIAGEPHAPAAASRALELFETVLSEQERLGLRTVAEVAETGAGTETDRLPDGPG
ncbi:MAG: hypothetical protein AAGF47_12750, partial [Planctomycetota bacterium]